MNMQATVVHIVLTPFRDNQDISFDILDFMHLGCSYGLIDKQRDVISSDYTLVCKCGLSLTIPRFGQAKSAILDVAIDGQSRMLSEGTFVCNQNVIISVSSRTE